ncbi:MAG: MEDS domain-containing protein [Gemmatimonadaceae bacterium]
MDDTPRHLAKVLADTACELGCTPPGLAGHDVQFYRTENYLGRAVVEFLGAGIRVGQPIIVIATAEHRRTFGERLEEIGLDPDKLFSGRLAVWLDARETLASFMEGALPNRDLFLATVGSVFERLLEKRYYLVVRAYGEMVDLLWKDGNIEGAIAVEQLWNELAIHYRYSLLCGYSLDNFLHEAGESKLRRVCGHHSRALPLESLDQNVA